MIPVSCRLHRDRAYKNEEALDAIKNDFISKVLRIQILLIKEISNIHTPWKIIHYSCLYIAILSRTDVKGWNRRFTEGQHFGVI